MIRAALRALRHIAGSLRREDGTASMEFVIVVPVILSIFMSSFESGLLMIREILLEQSVDMVMREMRLGHYPVVTDAVLKAQICNRSIIFPNCLNNIKIQLDRISTTTWAIPAPQSLCINSSTPIQPVLTLNAGAENDLMLVRVCVSLPAMFPGSGMVTSMSLDNNGNYRLVATSAFVVEPS